MHKIKKHIGNHRSRKQIANIETKACQFESHLVSIPTSSWGSILDSRGNSLKIKVITLDGGVSISDSRGSILDSTGSMLDSRDSISDSGGSFSDSKDSILESWGSSAITFRDVVQVQLCLEHGALHVCKSILCIPTNKDTN